MICTEMFPTEFLESNSPIEYQKHQQTSIRGGIMNGTHYGAFYRMSLAAGFRIITNLLIAKVGVRVVWAGIVDVRL